MRSLIVSGGPFHPFAETSRVVAGELMAIGIESSITEDIAGGLEDLEDRALLVVNMLRWRMAGAQFDADRDRWGGPAPETVRERIRVHLGGGGGILALHTAAVCFDDWPEWRDILGARWDWERSSHNALPRASKISVAPVAHPIVAGLGDFEVEDEIYSVLDIVPGVVPLLTSPRGGAEQPLLFARGAGGGRVVYDALGHDERSLSHPTHRRILRRAALWAIGRSDADVAAA